MSTFVFVYGTLKRNQSNHSIMDRAGGVFIGECRTDSLFTMISLGFYPAVLNQGVGSIKGEVYDVQDLNVIDSLERYPTYYDRMKVNTPFGPAWMYFMVPSYTTSRYPIVSDGDWSKGKRVS